MSTRYLTEREQMELLDETLFNAMSLGEYPTTEQVETVILGIVQRTAKQLRWTVNDEDAQTVADLAQEQLTEYGRR